MASRPLREGFLLPGCNATLAGAASARMNVRLVVSILGRLCTFLGLLLVLPSLVAFFDGVGGPAEWIAFLVAAGVAFAAGGLRWFFPPAPHARVGPAEGFACVTLGWVLVAWIGSLPFWLSGAIPSLTDSFFESMSGFTTTGASILRDIESLPYGILFWRSFTQWLGGMGIVALFIALLPALGAGGNFLFQAEVPGPTTDRLRPRISETAKLLWKIYLGLTVVLIAVLWGLGMTPFEAVCHSFTTLSTGGFSTRNASLGGFSAAIHWVIALFMFLAGANFTMHFLLLARQFRKVASNAEMRLYAVIVVVASALVVLSFYLLEPSAPARPGEMASIVIPEGLHDRIRHAVFNVVSVMTTTGFGTHDFERWPHLSRVLLVLLMFLGGCAGSTAGGIKLARVWLLAQICGRELRRLLHPSAVMPIKIGTRTVPRNAVKNTSAFFIWFVLIYVAGVMFMLCYGVDTGTALSGVVACLSNIGPGLSTVGPVANYASLPDGVKWMLSGMMLLGRLEIFAVLLLFLPSLWKK